ncbi:thioesterase II family protein [Streptomyces benahoarensis]|nr:alpha/beta fold hydrolase [Streptomyces benahoarensis]
MSSAPAVTDVPWLRSLRRVQNPRGRLVCFPHAGGAASFFREWPQRLAGDIEVLAVCYPGRESRINEPCVNAMEDLAAPLADALAPFLTEPTAFFGHSMGASVAYEVARRLSAGGRPGAAMLLVSGRAAPHRLRPSALGSQPDDDLISDVRRRGGPLAAALDVPDLLELVLPSIRADYQLVDSYASEATLHPLHVPVTAYYGEGDVDNPAESVLAWADVSGGPERFASRAFPGGHFFLVPHAADVLGDINTRLARVTAA